MNSSLRGVRPWLTTTGKLRVPQVTPMFWLIKGLSTAIGEATSAYLVHLLSPVPAVLVGFAGFVVALAVQFRRARYTAWTYWFAVVMVGIFGTMAADVMHVGFHVPYSASAVIYVAVLIAVFVSWRHIEGTLSIHSIDTPRREAFYWATVVATFATGTAVGDFTASSLHMGYFPSATLFAAFIVMPAVGYGWLRWNAVVAFWFAYVITRPLGASIADGLAKPKRLSGLGLGDGLVVAVFGILIVVADAFLGVTGADVQQQRRAL